MELTSKAFAHQGNIPALYTCQGEEINPPLEISGVPAEAQNLALIMDDPDVPPSIRDDRMWVHWVAYNIDPSITEIAEGTKPFATYGKNTSGSNAYQGPCPPDREHRYFFKLYALDISLDLPAGATKEELLASMEGHILAQAELMGRYEKS